MKPALPTLGINLVGWWIDSRGLPGGVGVGWGRFMGDQFLELILKPVREML